MTQPCPQCDGTGWKHIASEGKRYTVPCDCRAKKQLEEANRRPGGFESIGDIVARDPDLNDLLPLDTKIVGALIGQHRGQGNAITIREIGEELWAEEWRKGGAARVRIARQVKQAVRDLVTIAGMKIASSKSNVHGGYYIITSPEEMRQAEQQIIAQIRAEAQRLRVLRGSDDRYFRELVGQLAAEFGVEVVTHG